jgi:hypothetical protein
MPPQAVACHETACGGCVTVARPQKRGVYRPHTFFWCAAGPAGTLIRVRATGTLIRVPVIGTLIRLPVSGTLIRVPATGTLKRVPTYADQSL